MKNKIFSIEAMKETLWSITAYVYFQTQKNI